MANVKNIINKIKGEVMSRVQVELDEDELVEARVIEHDGFHRIDCINDKE